MGFCNKNIILCQIKSGILTFIFTLQKIIMFVRVVCFLLLFVLSDQVLAGEEQRFSLPMDCSLGQDCWIAQYVDVNPASDIDQDFKCGSRTYEGHKGTDFAVRSRLEMAVGVDVLSAAKGKVLRLRDGESDTIKDRAQLQVINEANKDCGNGVMIDHGGGYRTMYCHLRSGSIRVKPGQQVEEGEVLAQVGQSGMAEFAHLHFSVMKGGKHIDPFTGAAMDAGCAQPQNSMWKDVKYSPFAVFDGGFSAATPDFEAIKRGQVNPNVLARDVDALVYWVGFFQGQKEDRIRLEVRGPDGSLFAERDIVMEKDKARQFYFTGRSLKGRALKPGVYEGRAVFSRKGEVSQSVKHEIVVR